MVTFIFKLLQDPPKLPEVVKTQFCADINSMDEEMLPNTKHRKWLTQILLRNYRFLVLMFQTYS